MPKRIQISQHGGPEVMQIIDAAIPEPAADEVVVENKAIGINYIDTYVRSGLYPASLPSGLGTEAAGVVKSVGEGVTTVKVGDRVVYAQSALGAYSEYHAVAADKLALLPDAISFEQAAASFLKGLTVHYLLRQTYVVQPDETFLFQAAAGGVGLIACQWAKALGAHLIGTVGSAEKAARAKEAGAWETINYREEDVAKRVLELTNGKKVRVVYDSVGKDTWEASLDCLQRRGLMVSFGNASGAVEPFTPGELSRRGSLYITRPTLFDYMTNQQEAETMSAELFEMVTSGKVTINVNQTFPLAQAADAHRALESRRTTGSTVLLP